MQNQRFQGTEVQTEELLGNGQRWKTSESLNLDSEWIKEVIILIIVIIVIIVILIVIVLWKLRAVRSISMFKPAIKKQRCSKDLKKWWVEAQWTMNCALWPWEALYLPRLKGLCCTPCCRCHGATRGQQAGPNCIQQPGRCVLCVLLLDFEVAILLKELGAEADDASHLQANEIRTNTLGNYIWNQKQTSRPSEII